MRKIKLQPGEELLKVYRKSKMTLAPKYLQMLIILLLPWYFVYAYGFLKADSIAGPILLVWTVAICAYMAHIYTLWSLNVYAVTNKRLIHIQHLNVFKKTQIETPLERVLNVSFRTTSALSSLFNYGDVLVQVVGIADPLVLKKISHPEEAKDFIWSKHLQYGGHQKVTYTQPEIVSDNENIPYSPLAEGDDRE